MVLPLAAMAVPHGRGLPYARFVPPLGQVLPSASTALVYLTGSAGIGRPNTECLHIPTQPVRPGSPEGSPNTS